MNNPCLHCDKANIDFVNECEYGCDHPCQKAKKFFRDVGDRLDALLCAAKALLEKGNDDCNV